MAVSAAAIGASHWQTAVINFLFVCVVVGEISRRPHIARHFTFEASAVLRVLFRAARCRCQSHLSAQKALSHGGGSAKLFSALGLDHFDDGAHLFKGEILFCCQLEMTGSMKLGRRFDTLLDFDRVPCPIFGEQFL
jgi:hypothetical protein